MDLCLDSASFTRLYMGCFRQRLENDTYLTSQSRVLTHTHTDSHKDSHAYTKTCPTFLLTGAIDLSKVRSNFSINAFTGCKYVCVLKTTDTQPSSFFLYQNRDSVYIRVRKRSSGGSCFTQCVFQHSNGLYHNLTYLSFLLFLSRGQRLSTSNKGYTTQRQNKAPFSRVIGQFIQCKADGRTLKEQTEGTEESRKKSAEMGGQVLNEEVVLHCYR